MRLVWRLITFRDWSRSCLLHDPTKKSAKKIRKQVRGCLQNLYQSVAIT